jgi:FMN phosphatase YigB (HAD superfamily)
MLNRGAEFFGCSVEELNQLLYDNGWSKKLETGKTTELEFYEMVCNKFGSNFDYAKFSDIFNNIFSEITEIRPFLEYLLKIDFPRGILSNTSFSHWSNIIFRYDNLLRLIPNNHILSFEVGEMKPNRGIFEAALNTAKKSFNDNEKTLQRNEVLFIDDLLQNVSAAIDFGFDSIQFKNWQQVNDELKKRITFHSFLNTDNGEFLNTDKTNKHG